MVKDCIAVRSLPTFARYIKLLEALQKSIIGESVVIYYTVHQTSSNKRKKKT